MSNLEKFNSTKLSTSEMKEVQGGDWIDEIIGIIKDVVTPIITKITG